MTAIQREIVFIAAALASGALQPLPPDDGGPADESSATSTDDEGAGDDEPPPWRVSRDVWIKLTRDRSWFTVKRYPAQSAKGRPGGYAWTVRGLEDDMPAGASARALMKHFGADPGRVALHGLEHAQRIQIGPDVRAAVRALNDAWLHPRERTDPRWSTPSREGRLPRKRLSVVEFLGIKPDAFLWAASHGREAEQIVVDFLRDHAAQVTDCDALFDGAPVTSLPDEAADHRAIPLPSTDAMNRTKRAIGLDVEVFDDDSEATTFHDVIGRDPTAPEYSARDRALCDVGLVALRALRARLQRTLESVDGWDVAPGRRLAAFFGRDLASFVEANQRRLLGVVPQRRANGALVDRLPSATEIANLAIAAGFDDCSVEAMRLMQNRVDKILARGQFCERWAYNPNASMVSGLELQARYKRLGLTSDHIDPGATYDVDNFRAERAQKLFRGRK